MRTGTTTEPRRELTRTRSPSATASRRILRGQIQRLAAAQRRGVAARLHAGVERVEPAPGGQAQRELVVELVDRRLVLDRMNGALRPRRRSSQRRPWRKGEPG